MTKICKECKEELPIERFPKNGKYYKNTCSKCSYEKRKVEVPKYTREELKTITKPCKRCGEDKLLRDYTKLTTSIDGYRPICNTCLLKARTKRTIHILPKDSMKVCRECKEKKDISNFAKQQSNYDGLQNQCRSCDSKWRKAHRAKGKKVIQNYKEDKSCQKCGHSNYYSLDFHHVDKANKNADVSRLLASGYTTKLWDEIDKTVILCRNCHSEFHHLERVEGITLEKYLEES